MKKYIFFLLFLSNFYFASAWTLENSYQDQVLLGGGGFTNDYLVRNVTVNEGDTIIVGLTFNGSVGNVKIANATPTLVVDTAINNPSGGGTVSFRIFAIKAVSSGTKSIVLEYIQNGIPAILHTAIVSGIKIEQNSYSTSTSDSATDFSQTMFTISNQAFGFWLFTAQSGSFVTAGNAWTIVDHQPEVIAFGTGLAHNAFGYNTITLNLELNSSSQLWRGILVSFEPDGGGGGTSTQDYQYNTGALTTDDIFKMGSTTISFGTIDYTACDVTSIEVNPFASSSLSWGTFNIPQCILQSFKLLLFGTNGFDTYNVTNFVNTSSSTLPFLTFKFMGGALVYINPLTGELINLPNASSSLVFNIPMFGTTTPLHLNVMASSSAISSLQVPEAMDNVMATVEIVIFFVLWATIFRYINI